MPISGFHSEWITIKDHRIYLSCRASFPNDTMHFMAKVIVETCDNNSDNAARVTEINFNDKAGVYAINIASTNSHDLVIQERLEPILETIFKNDENSISTFLVNVEIFEPGDTQSDHYNHMEYLSIKSDVAVDRWRDKDSEYQKSVSTPY